ncbi:type 4a pilus biogenesis protein PilO [Planomonospora venezuelensis]|uniref:Type IV pilus assembly protein PilO n=1 Tax=Planomonospora venezuelensis TaxID=1999 RepID=A0A841DEI9_PLAVE|nr:type 4a pilus biogenesis protein PilO [Planomonospora venezuelensis]MBB5966718.1 type IV pilus assembly protein PilO [Planomonospora venezuelensis]GIN00311.1 hypothetical protein Pve01_19690 [Planomonospora venezuelensis]
MFTGRIDRLWIIGGVLVAAVLLAVGWFFLIGPQHDETDRLRADAESTQVQAATLRSRLAELSRENTKLPLYRAELETAREALPMAAGTEEFLRELQKAGDAAGVAVDGVNIGGASPVTAAGAELHTLPVAVTATGSAAELDRFLDQVQRVQPRAALIGNLTYGSSSEGESGSEDPSLTVNMKIFVAPPLDPPTAPAAGAAPGQKPQPGRKP